MSKKDERLIEEHKRQREAAALERKQQVQKQKMIIMTVAIAVVVVAAVIVLFVFGPFGRASGLPDAEGEQVEADNGGFFSGLRKFRRKNNSKYGDVTAPVIKGAENITVHEGEAISYKKGIKVEDDYDLDPDLDIDTSRVNLMKLGDYPVIYTATDNSGNQSSVTITVSVVSREIITASDAYEKADEILYWIVNDEMSDTEKLYAVYSWVNSIPFVDYSFGEPTDVYPNFYYYVESRMGNCRCSAAAMKVLLERLGYQVMIIGNSEEAMYPHYWNMVSIDNGNTWYHCDAMRWGTELFMVTDDWLLENSQTIGYASHLWDMDEFPQTPKEAFEF